MSQLQGECGLHGPEDVDVTPRCECELQKVVQRAMFLGAHRCAPISERYPVPFGEKQQGIAPPAAEPGADTPAYTFCIRHAKCADGCTTLFGGVMSVLTCEIWAPCVAQSLNVSAYFECVHKNG
jgi:hypothetical protein